ncbi:uncharacterized protein LOC119454024 [Dermacentor silvarum]|uniref:uncharacterized protein LOC119454024 n=1 Tax=Dermacentor silvarum TaxID=543639 RepID=UPI00210132F8|nr:uncharacterized protein LOC119454024 [Dermacentor silvarum]
MRADEPADLLPPTLAANGHLGIVRSSYFAGAAVASLAPGGSPPPSSPAPLDPNDPLLTNPTVALAVKSFRNMRSAALTPVARRLRDIMIKRQQLRQQQQQQMALQQQLSPGGGGGQDWTEVSIACPPPGTNLHGRKPIKGRRPLIPPGQLLRETLGADVLLLLGALLAFLGSAVTLLATYGRFGNPESRPTVLGLGPPLVGIGFVFCMLRLFFCKPQKIKNACCGWLLAARVHPSRGGNRTPVNVATAVAPQVADHGATYDATRFSQTWTIT